MCETILNVSSSLGNNKWIGNSLTEDRQAEFIMQKSDVSLLTATVLAIRGINPEEVDQYLNPKIKNLMPDPCLLSDMRKASNRLIQAVKNKENIIIYSDFDVDGTTAASLLILWLRHCGIEPSLYIPDRISEGYGPNINAFTKLAKKNTLLLCLDSGTQAFESVEAANKENCDVIIIDHHQVNQNIPKSFALINPKRKNEDPSFFDLCTAGLVFLVIADLNRISRKDNKKEFNLINCMDLVALATMADVVPLKGLNRAFVHQGVRTISKNKRPCFEALAEQANFRSPITDQALAFTFAPRINAAGRISDAKLATKLLTTKNLGDAEKYANKLETLNMERKNLEQSVLDSALLQAKIQQESGENILWMFEKGWHPGVIGIVASRIKETFKKPAIVIAVGENGVGIGSARSTKALDIGACFIKLKEMNLLISGGGHSMAAGLKIDSAKIFEAQKMLSSIHKPLNQEKKELKINAVLSTSAVSISLLEELNSAGPFGSDSPFPVVAFPNCTINHAQILGEKHIKISFSNNSGSRIEGILFNDLGSDIGQFLISKQKGKAHIAGRVEINEWGGRKRINLIIMDVASQ